MSLRACPHCKVEKPHGNFQQVNGRARGWCRLCRSETEAARRRSLGIQVKEFSQIRDTKKLCMECRVFKPFSQFSPAERGTGGLATYCKPCINAKYKDPESAREATARYRAKHREVHLANHRLRMWERKHKQKIGTDGTVTPEFLRSLYATRCCHYCFLYTSPEQRTADHRVPLAKGGLHSTFNLVMACNSCNSSKRDLSEQEFRARLMVGFDLESYLKHHLPIPKENHAAKYYSRHSMRSHHHRTLA